jgi:uncharacterized protein YwqG
MLNILRRLFGPEKPTGVARDIPALAGRLARPAIQLVRQDATSASHFGGTAPLPAGMKWPHRGDKPLTLLASLSLAELGTVHRIEWLPSSGSLLFFYDVDEQPWGFDPKDRGGWAVLHVPSGGDPVSGAPDPQENPLPKFNLGFRRIERVPPIESIVVDLNLSDAECDEYSHIAEEPFGELPKHQVGGFPFQIQDGSMELECQLASHGLYCGDSSGYEDPKAIGLRRGAANWRLLLQLDSDDDLEMMWGDEGCLYFWVEEQAAAAGDFANAWLVLQCS